MPFLFSVPSRFRCCRALGTALLALALGACAGPTAFLTNRLADTLAAQSQDDEDDLVLAREASAYHLKLSESVLRRTPGHLALAESVAAGFTQYAYAFVQLPADRLEGSDARGAQALRVRAARLYWRANAHALRALELAQPGLARELAREAPTPGYALVPGAAGLAYWAAASWGAAISLSKDRPDAVADLPRAVRLAQLAWAQAPDTGRGALLALLGNFEAARPGGSSAQAAAWFDAAERVADGRDAGVLVARAEALALPAGDRAAFEALLRRALEVAARTHDLGNQVMAERAQWLLNSLDELF